MERLNKSNKKIKVTNIILSLSAILMILLSLHLLVEKSKFNVTAESNNEQVISKQQEKQYKSNQDEKIVYLTFDDGPSALTGQFLDILKENDIKATFFMQGSNLQNTSFQNNVKRAAKEGHYIGAHSMTHNNKKLYTDKRFVPEMKETLSLINEITNMNPNLVRPPYGSAPGLKDKQIRDQIVEAEMKVWDWTIDSQDWQFKDNPNQIIENIKGQTKRDVEVVLMHEKTQTLQALPEIIKFYKEQGYEFRVYNDYEHFSLNFQKDTRM